MILETVTAPDDVYHHVTDQYPTNKVQEYINLDWTELDLLNFTKSNSTDPVTLTNAMKKPILALKVFGNTGGIIQQKIGQVLCWIISKNI